MSSHQRLQDGDYSKKLINEEKKYYLMIPINHGHLLVKENDILFDIWRFKRSDCTMDI